jgi:aldehyde dehydrogenase (NAD+)
MGIILNKLGVQSTNLGSSFGCDWLGDKKEIISSYNPANNSLIANVTAVTADGYEKIIQGAVKAQVTWRNVPAPVRAQLIRKIGLSLRDNKDFIGTLISLETGKSKQEGDGEVQEMIDMADFAVGQSRMLYGKVMPSERQYHKLYEQWHPLGVCGVITAFNFPAAVWSWNAFLAAICGNVIVWKPSPKAPLTAIAIHKICQKVMSEFKVDGVFSVFNSDDDILIEKFVDDKRVSLISFTGSTTVGKKVGVKVASRFGKSILELGGNNACIVDSSADLNNAIEAILFGAIGTAGQRCTSLRRLIVHESIVDSLISSLKHAYAQIKIGDPLDPETHMGPLIDRAAVQNYKDLMLRIESLGGEVICGGNVIKSAGNFVEPTLVRADINWPILQLENFVPVLFIMTYSDIEEAININNSSFHGLSSAIFSNDNRVIEQFLSASGSDCGLANVNMGTSGAEIGGAFGGEKNTGGGREAGSDAWKAYMRRQTACINWGRGLPLAQGIDFKIT